MRLAADANALLSAVLEGRARLVLDHLEVTEVLTAEETFAEVQEYAAFLARKRHLPLDLVLLAVATLPVTVVKREEYARHLAEATRRIGKRDPDDVPILALALALDIAVWSNDKDFEDAGVEWHTTAALLKKLGIATG